MAAALLTGGVWTALYDDCGGEDARHIYQQNTYREGQAPEGYHYRAV
jgi:hypothetical protein